MASFDPETVARVFAGYEAAKRDRVRIDFEDILLCAAALLSEHAEVADQVRRTYRHLVVDEYQDVSPLQEALLTLWRGDRTDLCVVGDPAQTIHSFAGAQASFLTGFARRSPGATVVRLVRDYRSTPQVVGLANAVMKPPRPRAPTSDAVTLQAQRPTGPEVKLAEAADEAAEAAAIADWLAAPGQRPGSRTGRWRCCSGSTPSRRRSSRRWPTAGSPTWSAAASGSTSGPRCARPCTTLRTQARAVTADTDGSGVEQTRALLSARWAGRPQPPDGAGRCGSAGSRWPRWSAWPRTWPGRPRRRRVGAISSGGLGRARSAGRGAARARGPGRDGRRPCTRPRVWSGTPWRCSAPRGHAAVRAGHHARAGRRGTPAALRRDHPGPAARCGSPGPAPATAARHVPQAVAVPGLRCCPSPYGGRGRAAAGRRRSRAAPCCRLHCRSCGQPLGDAAERKIGRHADCPATFDEQTMDHAEGVAAAGGRGTEPARVLHLHRRHLDRAGRGAAAHVRPT